MDEDLAGLSQAAGRRGSQAAPSTTVSRFVHHYSLIRRRLVRQLWFTLCAATVLGACGTDPSDDNQLFNGSYGTEFDPPVVVDSFGGCQRSIPHVAFGFNRLGDFDLSVNTVDDCTQAGGGFTFGEVLHLGSYTRVNNLLSFTPADAPAPLFTGAIEGEFIRLTLPPATGISTHEVELLVGPREAFSRWQPR
jgi:hypothetical protein